MKRSRIVPQALIAAVVGLAAGLAAPVAAQSQGAPGIIADNDSIFVDGKTFKITPGKAKGNAAAQIQALGARDLGPGALIFRSGERFYIVEAPLPAARGSAAGEGANPDQARPNRIRIEYVPPKNPEHQMLYHMIMEHRVLETLQQIFSPLILPTPLTIKTMGCDGQINAWYSVDDSMPVVHVCYEILQDVLQNVPKETTPTGITPRDAVVGQSLFWITHELGHAVFDIFQIPVLGREEDAADAFAGYILLQFGKGQARRLVGGAAYAANEVIKNYNANSAVEKRLGKYSSVHGLPEQRFYNLLCLAYGADPTTFGDVVEKGFLPKQRADHCDYEYQSFRRAWLNEISPHIDRQMARAVLDTTWLPAQSSQPAQR